MTSFTDDEAFRLAPLDGGVVLADCRNGRFSGLRQRDAIQIDMARAGNCDGHLTQDSDFQDGHDVTIIQFSSIAED